MRYALNWLLAFGSVILLAANDLAAQRLAPVPAIPGAADPTPATADLAEEKEMQSLLTKLDEMNKLITQNAQSPQAWRPLLEQGEVLLQLAARSKGAEQENFLRMAVDGFYSAAVTSPKEQQTAAEKLRQLPGRIARRLPNSPAIAYAIQQEIQADCVRVLEENGGDNVKAQKHRCTRLMQFAEENAASAEAPKAVLEAAHIRESLGETEEACRCYRFLSDHYADKAVGRKAQGALSRLGQGDGLVRLQLPPLYPSRANETAFNLDELRGKLVLVYFWSSTSARAAEDFNALKQVTDRFVGRGLEVVYVNMDGDPAAAKTFLSGRLMAGTHLYQKGGLDGAIAERCGILQVPHAFLVGRDGTVLRNSLPAAQLEAEIVSHLPDGRCSAPRKALRRGP